MKKIFGLRTLVACIFVFFLNSLSSADNTLLDKRPVETRFTLYQLSKINTALIKGHRPSYTFYLPIPEQWEINSIELSLIIKFSPLLLNSSSLTLMVGDTPVDSIQLNNTKEQPLFWQIRIPKGLITPKTTTVRLVGYLKVSENVCADLENQANWVTVSGNSSISYRYEDRSSEWSLLDFPYPFIRTNSPLADKVILYVPEKMRSQEFAPYFKFANTLSKKASWRGVEFNVKSIDEWPIADAALPSVIIGTPKTINFSLLGFPPSLSLRNNKWYDVKEPLKDDVGFVWLTHKGQNPVLIISANSTKGLDTAVESINSNDMHFMATNQTFFLAHPFVSKVHKLKNKTNISFQELGYKDNVVFGTGENQINYSFNIPTTFLNNPVKLSINYSHSPFLFKNRASTMSLSLNGLPIGGVELSSSSSEIKNSVFKLPSKQLQMGRNSLTITMNLILPNAFCSRDYLSAAWATIYNDSHLDFSESDKPVKTQIKSYPNIMEGEITVVLPEDENFYKDKKLMKELVNFSTTLSDVSTLEVVSDISLSRTNQNMIYFGIGTTKNFIIDSLAKTFTQITSNLMLTSSATLKQINKSLFENAFSKTQNLGFVSIQSIDSNKNTQLILYGFTQEDLKFSIGLLNNSFKRSLLTGDLAISFENGTFTSLSSSDIVEHVKREKAMERGSQLTLQYLLYTLIIFIIAIMGYLLWRKWRRK